MDWELEMKSPSDRRFHLSLEAEKAWAPILIQYEAYLQPPMLKETLALLGLLRMHRPSEKSSANEMKNLLKDMTTRLHERGFAKFAIEKGINDLIENRGDSVFFPTLDIIIEKIYPIDWKVRARINRLKEEFEKNAEQKLLVGNDEGT